MPAIEDIVNLKSSNEEESLLTQTDFGDNIDPCQVLTENEIYSKQGDEYLRKFHDECGDLKVNSEDADDQLDNLELQLKTQRMTELIGDHNGMLTDRNEVIPPENFSHVIGEIYRSSFPRIENFSFLQKRLKLKSILVLIPEEYPQENLEFLNKANIKLFQVGMSGNKEPFVNIPSDLFTKALEIVINPENQPILIHCNRGKHRTGCLIGCIRKLQNWSLTMIFDEYRRFSFPKARALDQQFIELYDDKYIKEVATKNSWLPLKW
ncbi:hypothetical protein TPHA_0C03470 [Tetrapisispora phaffii CBS 4417]|uniref:diphosphoinositol-polyphosphate diphosphatase n=1 Tax=Tetrapisispora phaffii (strain ATCC 24235 / CBS 4417 / NBRC 1672 / NRRL Y-8282 / UCD 70-5) TaxID=1071381 RepID=G8BRX3_TETPH|nr:hypothetical protein TPHA_0C03470 [Tetrapisispora phaffii CBS 4417]CCE62499.1 hypothetical protein TPHA_0C03470 [Tetrapisispora phaffii CBS 4417]